MSALLFALGLAVAEPASWVGFGKAELGPEIKTLYEAEPNFSQRFLTISQHFIGAPYLFSPLGEATGQDNDPLFTTKQFDCLSLVEISMALASTGDIEQAMSRLVQIRYLGDTVHYTQRKHFMESQWIPHNLKLGWISDITKQVGGPHTVRVSKRMSPEIYQKRKKVTELVLPNELIPNGNFTWPVIPLDKMMEVAKNIPSGAILFVVRQDYQSIPYRISHVGIVLQKKGVTYLRHAKDQGAHKVVEMPLQAVVNRHGEFTRWPVTGFSVYMPQQAAAKKLAGN